MNPTTIPSSQELLMNLYQRQAQNNLDPAGLLTQLMRINLQANLFKLLNPDASTSQSSEASQSSVPSLSNYMNQVASANTQIPSLQNPQLSKLLLYSKLLEGQAGMDGDSQTKPPTLVLQKENVPSNNRLYGNSSSIKIPPLNQFHEDSTQFLSPETQGEGDGLSAQSKKIKKSNICGHPERPHYAKNMCNQCYHKLGRTKKPWKCNHEKLYAHGLCQNCYINAYNKKRNEKLKENKEQKDGVNITAATTCNESETDVPTSMLDSEEPLTVEDKAAFGEYETIENSKPKETQN